MTGGIVQAAKHALRRTISCNHLAKTAVFNNTPVPPSPNPPTLPKGPQSATKPQQGIQAPTETKPETSSENIKLPPETVLSMLLGTSLGAFIFGNVFSDESRFNPYAAILGGTIGFMLGSGLGLTILNNSPTGGK